MYYSMIKERIQSHYDCIKKVYKYIKNYVNKELYYYELYTKSYNNSPNQNLAQKTRNTSTIKNDLESRVGKYYER